MFVHQTETFMLIKRSMGTNKNNYKFLLNNPNYYSYLKHSWVILVPYMSSRERDLEKRPRKNILCENILWGTDFHINLKQFHHSDFLSYLSPCLCGSIYSDVTP